MPVGRRLEVLKLEFDPLTPAEEIELRANMAPLLTLEQEVALGRRIQLGDEKAREQLITANLRLVVSSAMRCQIGYTLPQHLEYLQEGHIGLMKAVERFDYTKGYAFATFATFWIRQAIRRALVDKVRMISIPPDILEKISKIDKAEEDYVKKLGEPPALDALAKELGWLAAEIVRIKEIQTQIAVVSCLLDRLNERERCVLELRHGLNLLAILDKNIQPALQHDKPPSLEKIGIRFGIRRERVRQIELKALEKLTLNWRGRERLKKCKGLMGENKEMEFNSGVQ